MKLQDICSGEQELCLGQKLQFLKDHTLESPECESKEFEFYLLVFRNLLRVFKGLLMVCSLIRVLLYDYLKKKLRKSMKKINITLITVQSCTIASLLFSPVNQKGGFFPPGISRPSCRESVMTQDKAGTPTELCSVQLCNCMHVSSL